MIQLSPDSRQVEDNERCESHNLDQEENPNIVHLYLYSVGWTHKQICIIVHLQEAPPPTGNKTQQTAAAAQQTPHYNQEEQFKTGIFHWA